ncbi:hypothetical protein BGZ51_000562 [Haplosporangium sp. Z 767]|nr:hypothetical protein BGZ51_000562 [Haplosporangium sp. Z 767]KAF9194067.1 hypothetical protein BGZ50_006732 [Haplosporangium sp. Z 11]
MSSPSSNSSALARRLHLTSNPAQLCEQLSSLLPLVDANSPYRALENQVLALHQQITIAEFALATLEQTNDFRDHVDDDDMLISPTNTPSGPSRSFLFMKESDQNALVLIKDIIFLH